jgi:hypothetical protein
MRSILQPGCRSMPGSNGVKTMPLAKKQAESASGVIQRYFVKSFCVNMTKSKIYFYLDIPSGLYV